MTPPSGKKVDLIQSTVITHPKAEADHNLSRTLLWLSGLTGGAGGYDLVNTVLNGSLSPNVKTFVGAGLLIVSAGALRASGVVYRGAGGYRTAAPEAVQSAPAELPVQAQPERVGDQGLDSL